VVARFDQAQASTDGGVVLVTALDRQLQLTDQLVACLADRRDPDKIRHTVRDLLRQRIFGLACGDADGNDAARLERDGNTVRFCITAHRLACCAGCGAVGAA
jgi:hypothetical protein